jgi:hypothetical protein
MGKCFLINGIDEITFEGTTATEETLGTFFKRTGPNIFSLLRLDLDSMPISFLFDNERRSGCQVGRVPEH